MSATASPQAIMLAEAGRPVSIEFLADIFAAYPDEARSLLGQDWA